jgi:sigma-B regulation protein RsbU (phosphoserine phosphatase)
MAREGLRDAVVRKPAAELDPGDALVLYTDGVSEARSGDDGSEMGVEPLTAALSRLHGTTADAIAAAVTDAVFLHAGDADELDDDATIVVVSRDGVTAASESEATMRSRASLVGS